MATSSDVVGSVITETVLGQRKFGKISYVKEERAMTTIFLTGSKLARKIREVMAGKKPRMCVAFLKDKWVNELFEGGVLPNNLKVICDLKMRMTPRKALRAGRAPNNKRLRHLPDNEMHAKVYLSETGAIVCSANASPQALSSEGRIEDGIWVAAGTKAYLQIKETFKDRYKNATPVDQDALDAAPESASSTERPNIPAGLTLVQLLRKHPEAFQGIRFVCSTNIVDKQIRRAADELLDEELKDNLEPEDERPRGYFSDWDEKESEWPALFFSVYRGPNGGLYLSKHRHYRFLAGVKANSEEDAEDVFVSHRLGWGTTGAAFGDMPRLASQKRCKNELQRMFRSANAFANCAGQILTGEEFANRLLQNE